MEITIDQNTKVLKLNDLSTAYTCQTLNKQMILVGKEFVSGYMFGVTCARMDFKLFVLVICASSSLDFSLIYSQKCLVSSYIPSNYFSHSHSSFPPHSQIGWNQLENMHIKFHSKDRNFVLVNQYNKLFPCKWNISDIMICVEFLSLCSKIVCSTNFSKCE